MRESLRLAPVTAAALLVSTFSAWAEDLAPVYPTPQAALEALVAALETGDVDAAIAAMDPTAGDLVQADPAETAATIADLLGLYRAGYRFVPADAGVTIALGADGWPFPVPLANGPQGWSFDADAGRQEIRDREIGGNELEVIDILRQYLVIQTAYRTVDHDGDGVLEFGAALLSSDGRRDGLFWPGGDSPVGDIAARASLDGYSEDGGDKAAEPLRGYYFRVLTGQGPTAPGGAMSYLVQGHMVAGHAALAVPAIYGETGIHTFLVSEAGTVHQSDLGERTLEIGFEIESFDPGEGWEPVE